MPKQKYFQGDKVKFIIPSIGESKGEIIGQNGEFDKVKPFLLKIKDGSGNIHDLGQGYIISKIEENE
jgi:hypothetical protein